MRYLHTPIPNASLKMCHWYLITTELCFCYCMPFHQFHPASALFFQSRLESKRAVFACTCGGVMGGMRRQLQTLQWHGCNGADWSPIWPPAGPAGFSILQTPNPPSLRHHRHHWVNLRRPTIPHRLQPGHGFDIGCTVYFYTSSAFDSASECVCRIERYRRICLVFDEVTFSSSAFSVLQPS